MAECRRDEVTDGRTWHFAVVRQGSSLPFCNHQIERLSDPEDSARIAGWFEEAAASGDLVAAFNLGVCLVKGVGVTSSRRRPGCATPPMGWSYRRILVTEGIRRQRVELAI
jgi:hypothetical protein